MKHRSMKNNSKNNRPTTPRRATLVLAFINSTAFTLRAYSRVWAAAVVDTSIVDPTSTAMTTTDRAMTDVSSRDDRYATMSVTVLDGARDGGGGGEAHGHREMTAERMAPRRAYVTLLYSDFLHGTRALGQSLRDTGTSADTVVLVTPDVTEQARDTLSKDGWM